MVAVGADPDNVHGRVGAALGPADYMVLVPVERWPVAAGTEPGGGHAVALCGHRLCGQSRYAPATHAKQNTTEPPRYGPSAAPTAKTRALNANNNDRTIRAYLMNRVVQGTQRFVKSLVSW